MKIGFAVKAFSIITHKYINFSYSKQDKLEKASKVNKTNPRKLPQILGMNTKLTKLVSSFYHFPGKSSTLNYFQT